MNSVLQSIKGRLFLWIFLFISVLLIVRGTSIYYEVQKDIYDSVKLGLHSKIQILKGLLQEENGQISLEPSEIILGDYSIPRSGHYYKVVLDGNILAVSPSLAGDDFHLASGELESLDEDLGEKVYISTGPANEPIMVVLHDFHILNKDVVIYAARSLEAGNAVINRFIQFIIVTVPVYIAIIAFAGLWIAKRSLKPLKMFYSRIEKITHRTLGERIEIDLQPEEIKGLARSFNGMLDRLQKAFDSEKRLIADASHELKTPLSVIKTRCDILLQKDRSVEEYTRSLHIIKSTSDTMRRLIDDMLSLARLDSGVLSSADFTTIPLNDCLKQSVKLAEVLAEKGGINIQTSLAEDVYVSGNLNTLTEAFLNIIENAIKYNRPGGSVNIAVSKKGGRVGIRIEDNGTGIEKNDKEKIFDRFYRGRASRNMEGTGLGLSIASAIIKAHSGEINVRSEVSKGSCFDIILPI
ncbi:MAG TPA: histidine kinase [Nitrospiraceae bacterium]|nr:histidine kinase [Nitrospiraceae bacterium]